VPLRHRGPVPPGKDAGGDRADPGLFRHHRRPEVSTGADRCHPHRPLEHRARSDDPVELVAAARREYCGLSVPGAGVPGTDHGVVVHSRSAWTTHRNQGTKGRSMKTISPTSVGGVHHLVGAPWPLPPFDFQPLTRVVFGPGSLARLGELTRELGGTRVLLVTDPGLEEAGHPQRALAILRDAGLDVWVFDAVEQNPTTHHVHYGLAQARK